jgi:hypothetical protein
MPVQSATNFFGTPGLGRINQINNLDIANGMTAGYGVNDGHVDNPPAFEQMIGKQLVNTYGGNPNLQPQRIGLMRNIAGTLSTVYSLYFIFNPNEIQVAFSTNLTSVPPMYLYGNEAATNVTEAGNAATGGAIDSSVPNLTNSQVVSWSLIFDRTYDMLFDPNPDENRGVLKDVAALYNLMGTFQGGSQAGVPISTPIECVFAQTSDGELWGITGYISSVTITYGIFRHNMIPSRCEIDLQMTTTYVGPNAPTSASGASSVNSNGGATTGGLVTTSTGFTAPSSSVVQGPPNP